MRRLILIVALAAALAVAAGCSGEESATCENLGDLQASVEDLREIEPAEGALDEVQQSLDEIEAEIAATRDAAEEELRPELDAFETAVRTLVADVEAAVADGLSRSSLSALAASVSSAAAAFETLVEAAPDCDL